MDKSTNEQRRQQFRNFRHAAKLSQVKAANYIGVTTDAVVKWETGRRPVPQYAMNLIQKAMEDCNNG